jgi:hypothetical protein
MQLSFRHDCGALRLDQAAQGSVGFEGSARLSADDPKVVGAAIHADAILSETRAPVKNKSRTYRRGQAC